MNRGRLLRSEGEHGSSDKSSDRYDAHGHSPRIAGGIGAFESGPRGPKGSLEASAFTSPDHTHTSFLRGQRTSQRFLMRRSQHNAPDMDQIASPSWSHRASSGNGATTSASATPSSSDSVHVRRNGQGKGSAHRTSSESEHGHEADTEGADEESEFAAVWEAILRDDAPTEERPVHIEKELQPYRVIGTGLALSVLLLVMKNQAFDPKSMTIAVLVMIFGEYLSDFSWFQVISGLSIGMIFAVIIVFLAVVRRYSKPSALGGAIALGCIKFKLNVRHIFRVIAVQLGIDVSDIAIPIIIISGILLFIASSIWYCTSSFPVVRFQKFLKFFLNVIIGGGMVCYSFYSKCPDISLEMNEVEGINQSVLSWGGIFEMHRRWVGASVVVYLVLATAFRWVVLRRTVDDICVMVDEKYGANKVVPVRNYVGFKSPAEVRRTSQDFTKIQLEKLHQQLAAIPREHLADMLSPEAYFQVTQRTPSPSIMNSKVAIAYSILILMLIIAYAVTSWMSGDALFEIPIVLS